MKHDTRITMSKKTLKDLRKHFPLADTYLEARVLEGGLTKCTYPSNGVPELRKKLRQVSVDDMFAVGEKRG